jgi:hypothetical protein
MSAGGSGGVVAAGGSTGSGGEPPDAGCPTAAAPAADRGAALCLADGVWTSGELVATASTAADDILGSITPDELTITWMTIDNGTPTLYYADRAAPDAPFGPKGTLSYGPGYYAAERPAVSFDGQRIVVVRADRKGFTEYSRTAVFATFTSAPSEASFDAINGQGIMLAGDEYFGDPLLSADDKTFYYSKYDGRSANTVFAVSRDVPDVWLVGSPVEGAPLRGGCRHRRSPTGISADELTLFYWDDLSGTERATFRATVGAPFSGVVDLGPRGHAQPNASCDRLYYSAPETNSTTLHDIAFASR